MGVRERYPNLFESCISWDIPKGWDVLVTDAVELMVKYIERLEHRKSLAESRPEAFSWYGSDQKELKVAESFYFVQGKEKFTCLEIYSRNATPYIQGVIDMAEQYSMRLCQKCGRPSSDKPERMSGRRMCDSCKDEEKAYYATKD